MATNTKAGSTTNRQKIRQYLRDFNFKALFVEELGWGYCQLVERNEVYC